MNLSGCPQVLPGADDADVVQSADGDDKTMITSKLSLSLTLLVLALACLRGWQAWNQPRSLTSGYPWLGNPLRSLVTVSATQLPLATVAHDKAY